MTIKGNTTTQADGIIYIKNPAPFETLFVSITNSIFSENTNLKGFGGIYIETTGFQILTTLYVEGSIISNNIATQGAAIFLNEVKLSEDSYIRLTTFNGNDVERFGSVLLWFVSGIMTIENNTFENNTGE